MHRTACGIVSNLFRLLSPHQLREWGIERIKLAGNASRNYFMDEIIRQCEGILKVCASVDTCSKCSAAYGAALHALHFSHTRWMQSYVAFIMLSNCNMKHRKMDNGQAKEGWLYYFHFISIFHMLLVVHEMLLLYYNVNKHEIDSKFLKILWVIYLLPIHIKELSFNKLAFIHLIIGIVIGWRNWRKLIEIVTTVTTTITSKVINWSL